MIFAPTNPIARVPQWLSAACAAVLWACLAGVPAAVAQLNVQPEEVKGIDIVEHSGNRIPLDLEFKNSDGKPVKLGEFFNTGKPVVLAMVYFRCPLMCPMVLNKLSATLNQIDWSIGDKFNVVLVSFDPTEGPVQAAKQKNGLLMGYHREQDQATDRGFGVLTGRPAEAQTLSDALGFPYKYIESTGEFTHSTCIFVLTPDGRISRYLYGIGYQPETVRMALLEASDGKIGTTIDRVKLWCFHFDPTSGAYVVQAMRVMQVGGVLSAIAVGGLLWWMVSVDRRRRHALVGSKSILPGKIRSQLQMPGFSPGHSAGLSP